MRGTRALKMMLAVTLTVMMAPVAGVASAAETSTLTIRGRPAVGVFLDDIGPSTPDRVRHRGRLTADGVPVAGALIHLQRKLVGGEWQTVTEEAETDPEGRYEFLTGIEGNARYRVFYERAGEIPAAVSGLAKLKAMRDFNAELVEKEQRAILRGNINPGWERQVVQWQRKKCKSCDWSILDKERSGDNGTWRFAASYPPVGERWTYRAAIRGTDDFVESYSANLITTTTTPARQPAARTVGG